MSSDYDTAGVNGGVLFGGMLDRCRTGEVNSYEFSGIDDINHLIHIQPHTNNSISSAPYELCICNEHQITACDKTLKVEVYRGQMFEVSPG